MREQFTPLSFRVSLHHLHHTFAALMKHLVWGLWSPRAWGRRQGTSNITDTNLAPVLVCHKSFLSNMIYD